MSNSVPPDVILNYIHEGAKALDMRAACYWFSWVYSSTLIFLVGSAIFFIVGFEKAPKKINYIGWFWITAMIVSIVTTIGFRFLCQQELPKREVLAYFWN